MAPATFLWKSWWGLAQTSPSTFLSPSHPLSLPQAVQEEQNLSESQFPHLREDSGGSAVW